MTAATSDPFFHGSAVTLEGRGVLMIGPSGAGKSAMAAELVSRGGLLVGDDRLQMSHEPQGLFAAPRPGFEGQLECRGVGILTVPHTRRARLHLVVDMGREERDRLPPPREILLLGCKLPLLHRAGDGHFAAALMLQLQMPDP